MSYDKVIEILDLDIVFNNNVPSVIGFLELRDGSPDFNEYYEAEVIEGGQHFELETVNRYVIAENLIDTEVVSFKDVEIAIGIKSNRKREKRIKINWRRYNGKENYISKYRYATNRKKIKVYPFPVQNPLHEFILSSFGGRIKRKF